VRVFSLLLCTAELAHDVNGHTLDHLLWPCYTLRSLSFHSHRLHFTIAVDKLIKKKIEGADIFRKARRYLMFTPIQGTDIFRKADRYIMFIPTKEVTD
jgi:hypothetical protein